MARKSEAARSVLRLIKPARLRPPADLPEPERKIWLETVGGMAAEHFKPIDRPLLRSFCRVSALVAEAAEALRREGTFDEDGGKSQWLEVFTTHLRVQMQLARTLRITHQARVDKTAAGKAAREAEPEDGPPWMGARKATWRKAS